MTEAIARGSEVRLHYRLSLADGSEIDSTYDDQPVTVRIGEGDLIEGLERRLLGLRAGDRSRLEIPALEAYGPVMLDAVTALPRSDFPPDLPLEPGEVIGFTDPQGREVPGKIVAVSETEVTVDFSHPLAGYDVVFYVEIVSVAPRRPDTPQAS